MYYFQMNVSVKHTHTHKKSKEFTPSKEKFFNDSIPELTTRP